MLLRGYVLAVAMRHTSPEAMETITMMQENNKEITRELLDLGKSSNGSYSKKQRELLGISPPWPPNLMPITARIGFTISKEDYQKFIFLKNHHLKVEKSKKNRKTGTMKRKSLPIESPKLKKPSAGSSQKISVVKSKSPSLEDIVKNIPPSVTPMSQGTVSRDINTGSNPGGEENQARIEREHKCQNCDSKKLKASGTGNAICMDCGYYQQ